MKVLPVARCSRFANGCWLTGRTWFPSLNRYTFFKKNCKSFMAWIIHCAALPQVVKMSGAVNSSNALSNMSPLCQNISALLELPLVEQSIPHITTETSGNFKCSCLFGCLSSAARTANHSHMFNYKVKLITHHFNEMQRVVTFRRLSLFTCDG